MPTKKPRVMIVMEEDTYNTFIRFKTLTGKSLSSVLSEAINELAPAFSKLCDTLESASRMDREAKDSLIARMNEVEASLSHKISDLNQQDWVDQAGGKRRSSAAPKKRKTTKNK